MTHTGRSFFVLLVLLLHTNAFIPVQSRLLFPRELSVLSSSSYEVANDPPTTLKRQPTVRSSETDTSATLQSVLQVRGGSDKLLPEVPPPQPTFHQFRTFALPCLGLWVAQPLLSLVDTAFVGLSGDSASSARQLAALGPATTFFDGATFLFAFLNVATTNLYSSARAQAGEQSDRAESVVRTASRVAVRCGFAIMAWLLLFSRPLLALYIGEQAAQTPGLLDSAVDYVKIRALSMPTSLLLGVIQAACLGAQDSVTPLIAIVYSTLVNVLGDFLLVRVHGLGLRGAAIATLFAQWVATWALLGPARRRLVRDQNLGVFQVSPPPSKGTVNSKSFLGFAAPVLTLILGKLAAFGFLTNSAAGVPGQPTPLAAHQIILSLFFFVSPFLEVISQTAQTFIPPFLAPLNDYIQRRQVQNPDYNPSVDPTANAWRASAFRVGTALLKLGLGSGIVVASLATLVPALGGSILTSNSAVQEAVKPLAKFLWFGAALTAPVAVSEGILLARRELKFLAFVYVASTALLPPALLQVKRTGGNVEQIWGCFALFQLFRALCFVGRIWIGPLRRHLMKSFSVPGSATRGNAVRKTGSQEAQR
eukprot:Nitzschia sp. Nitz4//scaffold308_size21609//897//2761//NITZ4_008600-RA/size21609-augustus-gene-0.40-mRNA-1//1//CDS//3329547146//3147//frame0